MFSLRLVWSRLTMSKFDRAPSTHSQVVILDTRLWYHSSQLMRKQVLLLLNTLVAHIISKCCKYQCAHKYDVSYWEIYMRVICMPHLVNFRSSCLFSCWLPVFQCNYTNFKNLILYFIGKSFIISLAQFENLVSCLRRQYFKTSVARSYCEICSKKLTT